MIGTIHICLLTGYCSQAAKKTDLKPCRHSDPRCQPAVVVIMAKWQRDVLLQQNSWTPRVVCLDATGCMFCCRCVGLSAVCLSHVAYPLLPALNHFRWPLYGLCGADQRGEALPIAFMLTSSENHVPIVKFLQVLYSHVPMWFGTLALHLSAL